MAHPDDWLRSRGWAASGPGYMAWANKAPPMVGRCCGPERLPRFQAHGSVRASHGRKVGYSFIFFIVLAIGQFLSAALAAKYVPGGFSWADSAMIGFGMLGRAELFFVVLNICYTDSAGPGGSRGRIGGRGGEGRRQDLGYASVVLITHARLLTECPESSVGPHT